MNQNTHWDDLKTFLTVARQGNLDLAATQLGLDPTTIGRRLRRLEKSLGATLFERSRRGHSLTPTGEWMLGRTEEMEHLVSDIQQSVMGEAQSVTGTVRLSVTEAFGNVVIAPAMIKLIREYPELRLELVATSGFLSVSKREADMAVMLSRPTTGRLRVSKLTDYDLKLYATESYLKEHPVINEASDLHSHTLIGYVDDLIYSPNLRYYEDISPGLTPGLTSSSLMAQKQLACSGCGIAALPKFVGELEPSLKLVLADSVTITRTFWLAIHEDIFEHGRIRAVRDFLNDLVSQQDL